jgi:hypothetical protein
MLKLFPAGLSWASGLFGLAGSLAFAGRCEPSPGASTVADSCLNAHSPLLTDPRKRLFLVNMLPSSSTGHLPDAAEQYYPKSLAQAPPTTVSLKLLTLCIAWPNMR